MARPMRDFLRGTQIRQTVSRSKKREEGRKERFPVSIVANQGGTEPPGCGRIWRAIPPNTNEVPNVAIKGSSWPNTTRAPLRAPVKTPIRSVAHRTGTPPPSHFPIYVATKQEERLIRLPTERSIPPVITTNVCAMAPSDKATD